MRNIQVSTKVLRYCFAAVLTTLAALPLTAGEAVVEPAAFPGQPAVLYVPAAAHADGSEGTRWRAGNDWEVCD
jgi:hypothetical protein